MSKLSFLDSQPNFEDETNNDEQGIEAMTSQKALFFKCKKRFFFLEFKVFNVPSVARNCSLLPQQDIKKR